MGIEPRLLPVIGLASAIAIPLLSYVAPVSAAPSQASIADGTYTGQSADAYYGNVQVQVVIQHGAIAGFKLLSYPSHTRTSIAINRQALPILAQEVISAQSVQVDTVSGATLSSEAFLRSVASALPR